MAPDPSCVDLEAAYCHLIFQCNTYEAGEYYGNDPSTCTRVLGEACTLSMAASGSSEDSAWNEGCAKALAQITTCEAWSDSPPAACQSKAGTLADGAGCSNDSQCKGRFCSYAQGSECGTCAERPAPPGCVFDDDCTGGQYCNQQGACVAPGAVGATCDGATSLCKHSLFCQIPPSAGDAGTPTGKCAARIAAGQPCKPGDVCANGNVCGAQGTCVAMTFGAVGASCDEVMQFCLGSYCSFGSSTATTGSCVAYVPIGNACDAANGPPCADDGICVSGKCAPPASCH